jgi:hypothetical protein
LIHRTQNWANIDAEFAENARIMSGVHGLFVDIVENIDRTNRDARGATHTLSFVDYLSVQHVDRFEASSIIFRAPRVGPFVGIAVSVD